VLAERLAAELVLERLVVAPGQLVLERLVPVRLALLARLASWSGRSH